MPDGRGRAWGIRLSLRLESQNQNSVCELNLPVTVAVG